MKVIVMLSGDRDRAANSFAARPERSRRGEASL